MKKMTSTELISRAFSLMNTVPNSTEGNIEKAKIYTLMAVYNELKTLNSILSAKFNIEFVEENNPNKE